ncbi:MAG: DEAD/DEAH box helicase family protein [Geobacteraceae bacterium]|nr:DEAD/DEAH box helicase family protein [Geobacteraceae bacterium]
MDFKFDPALPHQTEAVNAVINIFDGQPLAESTFSMAVAADTFMGQIQTETGLGNRLVLDDVQIFANVKTVQEQNNIAKTVELQGRNFSIEMETGTGKTYVYLRTLFELNKLYGFCKFIIVVPSVAIREGVLTSIDLMQEHFRAIYNHVPFNFFVYDSRSPNDIRQFATANTIQIMVINIQAFQKDVKDDAEITAMTPEQLKKLNVINRESDRLSGRKPMEFIQATNPIVIIDEPQSVEGDTSKGETLSSKAILRLNPLCTLRYSATHKNYHNLLYKLDPVQAYDMKLVKRIEVASVRAEGSQNDAFVKLEKVDNRSGGIRATLAIHVGQSGKAVQKSVTVKRGNNLFSKSRERQEYQDGFIVHNIDCTPGAEYVEFSNGLIVELGAATGGLSDEVMKAQVRETIEQHLKKERVLKGSGIKVLSLFFIDRVSNYRVYNEDGTYGLGKIGKWFEEAYRELTGKFKGVLDYPVEQVHNGYFSQDKKGVPKDTSGTTKEDDDTYAKIMRNKKQLLSLDEPLRFIFSHSALKEGWDNPNVFQICTLNETRSADRKRQEVGRGLRLPVNQNGDRIQDEQINRLTVIANESYEEFARKLQTEYEEDYGIRFGMVPKEAFSRLIQTIEGEGRPLGQEISALIWEHLHRKGYLNAEGKILDLFDPENVHFRLDVPPEFEPLRPFIVDELNRYIFKRRVIDARKKKEVTFNKQILLNPDFEALWKRISQRTRFSVKFSTEELIVKAAERLKAMPTITPVRIETKKVQVNITKAGVTADTILEDKPVVENIAPPVLPDLLAYLQNETELTRHTLTEIIRLSGRANDFKINPQMFITLAVKEISRSLRELMLGGINYKRIENDFWDMQLLNEDDEKEVKRYLCDPYRVKNLVRTTHDYIDVESNVEREFAMRLDGDDNVKVFMKLPRWFKIDTPLGSYNPDWAIVYGQDERVYMVRETKDKPDKDDLREQERKKVDCGEKHFAAIDVDFMMVTNLTDALRPVQR